MRCSLCPKTAMYQVLNRGFCGDHKAEACKAEKARLHSARAFAITNDSGKLKLWGPEADRQGRRGLKFDRVPTFGGMG